MIFRLQGAVKILEGWINICLKFESPEAHEDKPLIGDFVFDFEIELGRRLPPCSYLSLRYLNHNLNAFFCFCFFRSLSPLKLGQAWSTIQTCLNLRKR
ncbi:hypothetical protein RchiOBHm_Chr5g0033411 [Rosa chinensis]|uniref:Uncharacterized protein n=1 Tax=Rosa chinensis TaxID=74649 RepID=A0A2P6QAP9_ROSCH|nr:hypothetical protein RchiOBHm_Chr5g0033411 [Rosa chinensis]